MLRRGVVVATVLAFAGSSAQAAHAPLPFLLGRALLVPHVSPARSAALAVDLATGAAVFSRNESLSLAPASNEKLALTYALLQELGPEFRIETVVFGEGERRGSTWQGDLVLKGYGDPMLRSAGLARLAGELHAAGIRRVTGAVVGDESFFDTRRTAPGWKLRFYMDESPPLSALAVDRGVYRGALSPAPAVTAAARFAELLRARGVAVGGAARAGSASVEAVPLATISSPPLATIVRFMDRESDNFTAELLLKQLGALTVDQGTTSAGAGEVTRVLAAADVPMRGVRIVDGSGLSRLDRLTVGALVAILRASWSDPDVHPTLVGSLAVAGLNGTLQDRMRLPPARGAVVAKTGTTDQASALAGYVNGRYAFAVLQNGSPLPTSSARLAQDRFASLLAGGG